MSITESVSKQTTDEPLVTPKVDLDPDPGGNAAPVLVDQTAVEEDDGSAAVDALDEDAPDYIGKLAKLAQAGNKAAEKRFAELSGRAENRDAGAVGEMDDVIEGEKSKDDSGLEDDQEFSFKSDGKGNYELEADEGLGPLGKIAAGKDGAGVGGIEIAEDLKAGFFFGPNDQKVELEVDKDLTVPPPDGLELDIFKIAIPLGPGFGFDFGMTFESSLEFGSIAFALERRSSEAIIGKQSDALESKTEWELGGSAGMEGEAQLKLEASMWGGIPLIAALRAGVRAALTAGVESEVKLGGQLETIMSSAAEGQKPTLISREGQVFFQASGEGLLEAALSLFAGFELFMYKGDIYELVLARCPLANLAIGARFGANLAPGAKPDFFKEPTAANSKGAPRYLAYDFGLIERLWKARKLDKAKAASTEAKANAGSLSDVQDLVMETSTSTDESGNSVEQQTLNQDKLDALVAKLEAGEDAGVAPNAAMVKLMNEDTVLKDNLEGTTATILKMQNEYGKVKDKDVKEREGRWFGKGWRGDSKQLKAYKKELAQLEANVTRFEARRRAIALELAEARKAYAASLKGLDGPALLAKVKQAMDTRSETYKEQWKFFNKEFDSEIEANRVRAEGLAKGVEEAQLKVLRKQDELEAAKADYEARKDQLGDAEADLQMWEHRVDDHEEDAADAEASAESIRAQAEAAKKKRGFFSSKSGVEKDLEYFLKEAKLARQKAKTLREKEVAPRVQKVAQLRSKSAINQRRNELHAAQALLISRQQQARQFQVESQVSTKGAMEIITGVGVGKTRREKNIEHKLATEGPSEGLKRFQAAVRKVIDDKKLEGVDPDKLVGLKDAVSISGLTPPEFANLVGAPGSPFTVYPSGFGRRYHRDELEAFAKKRAAVSVK